MMGRAAAAVPLTFFQEYFSNWAVTWPPVRPQERGGGSEPDQGPAGRSGTDPPQSGLTTLLCQGRHPAPRR